ncbi:DCC1-like thiol-disulfide oxidoreductase family protein [Gramella sp. MAR_2010_147]|uniref:thiol-disulfide oxidoreductase DCC family protein n=1 Tax=Gramella sp. MAR_2010_147 TaxID=1250205 RepID=UPI00087D2316|nr:DCC1-like thiol-disulfide oxidoreductase family protein [Gramella sp. MAR_2010_147]SDR69127.1 Predicted thiol-disulfide oxidoreductase YuxK, DCC family [Gramella sp. MAR_2010_147]
MFEKIKYTKNPPANNILIWDGDCGFCKFWKTRWEIKTKGKVDFKTFQEEAVKFPDIPVKEFKKASRLIETDGQLYSGPDSAYRSMWHSGNRKWHELYSSNTIFRSLSDHSYNHIAKNRALYFKLTKILVGDNPLKFKPYWLLYLILFIIFFSFI